MDLHRFLAFDVHMCRRCLLLSTFFWPSHLALFISVAALYFDGELLVTGGFDKTVRVQRNSRDCLEKVGAA